MTHLRAAILLATFLLLTAGMVRAQQTPPVPPSPLLPYYLFYGTGVYTDRIIPFDGLVDQVGIVGYSDYDGDTNLLINPVPTNITFSDGATWQNDQMFAYETSIITVAGNPATVDGTDYGPGRINGKLSLYDTSTLNVSDQGIVSRVDAFGFSTVNVTGGAPIHEIDAYDNSTVNLTKPNAYIGDTLGSLPLSTGGILLDGSATFNMTSGGVSNLEVDNGTANISGGTVNQFLYMPAFMLGAGEIGRHGECQRQRYPDAAGAILFRSQSVESQ